MKAWVVAALLLGALGGAFWLGQATAWVGNVAAQEGKHDDPAMGETPPWMKLTQEHKDLQKSVGTWQVQAKMMMGPAEMPFEGVAKRESIMGGRFIQETFTCEMMGMAFEGRLIEGFDPISKEYVSVWIDNSSPYMSISRGKMKGDLLTMTGKSVEPETGKICDMVQEIKLVSEDESVMSMYKLGAEGSKEKTMHMVYRRKK